MVGDKRDRWSPDSFRCNPSLAGEFKTKTKPKPKPKRAGKVMVKGPFLRGPVPMTWLLIASEGGNSALCVGIILWHISGKRKGLLTFSVSNYALAKWGVDRKQKYRALRYLEKAGLISTKQVGHASIEVTILCAFGEVPGEDPEDEATVH